MTIFGAKVLSQNLLFSIVNLLSNDYIFELWIWAGKLIFQNLSWNQRKKILNSLKYCWVLIYKLRFLASKILKIQILIISLNGDYCLFKLCCAVQDIFVYENFVTLWVANEEVLTLENAIALHFCIVKQFSNPLRRTLPIYVLNFTTHCSKLVLLFKN